MRHYHHHLYSLHIQEFVQLVSIPSDMATTMKLDPSWISETHSNFAKLCFLTVVFVISHFKMSLNNMQ